ncbi:MAG: MATE family efflux transporter [Sphaerochaetaceae bacterium]|nr:MATE family efflux transporter [Sphaerochaetaceae bacterium]
MRESFDDELIHGPINRQIWKLSFPTMAGMLLQAVYDLVDMIWIGYISPAAVAATTIFITLFWIVEVLNEIIGTSSVSLISQSYGTGDLERTRLAAEQTLIFKALLATIGAVLMLLVLQPAIGLFSKDPEVIRYGMEYGVIRLIFLPIFFSSYSVNTIFRCTGDAKTPMKLLIFSAILNMIADPLLMFDVIPGTSIRGLGWGMKGAAIATVGSITIAFVIGLLLLLKKDARFNIRLSHLFKLDLETDKKLFTIGLPAGFNLILRNIAGVITLKLIGMYGTAALAILGVATRIYQFGMMPAWGIMMGSGIIIGQNLGAEKSDRALQAVRLTTINCMLFVGFFASLAMLFPKQILSLFLGGVEISFEGMAFMRIIGPSMLIGAAGAGMGSAFTGSGENKPLLYSSLVSQYAMTIPYSLAVVLLFKLPIIWLWFAYLLGDGSEWLVRWLFYRKKKWLSRRV